MSLIGYRARNHPQQTTMRGADQDVDDRAITAEDFALLDTRFRFTIDAAATAANARLPRYWTVEDDALSQSWAGERVWCNPPYSQPGLELWVQTAWNQAPYAELIVMLVPANRTEQQWWQRQIEPFRDRRQGLRTEFLPGRMRFLRNGAPAITPNERPPFGCCLLIWGGVLCERCRNMCASRVSMTIMASAPILTKPGQAGHSVPARPATT